MSTGLLHQEMRRTYAAQRGVSQGASITLAAVSGGFQARLECAERAAKVLGDRNSLYEKGKLLFLDIPMQDAHSAITKLAETFSVALVDTVTDDQGTRFVLVWKIVPRVPPAVVEQPPDTAIVDPNQGILLPGDDLDEY